MKLQNSLNAHWDMPAPAFSLNTTEIAKLTNTCKVCCLQVAVSATHMVFIIRMGIFRASSVVLPLLQSYYR